MKSKKNSIKKYALKRKIFRAIQLTKENYSELCKVIPEENQIKKIFLHDKTKKMLSPEKMSNTIGLMIRGPSGICFVTQGNYILVYDDGTIDFCSEEDFNDKYEEVF